MKVILTVDEVIAELGGIAEVAKLTGATKPNVCNWRAKGLFSARVFNVMHVALEHRGVIASPSLWGQVGSTNQQVAA